jgi:hypothetical protein
MREIPRQAAELKWIPGLALQGYEETIKNPTVPFFSYHPPESAENTQILLFFFASYLLLLLLLLLFD